MAFNISVQTRYSIGEQGRQGGQPSRTAHSSDPSYLIRLGLGLALSLRVFSHSPTPLSALCRTHGQKKPFGAEDCRLLKRGSKRGLQAIWKEEQALAQKN